MIQSTQPPLPLSILCYGTCSAMSPNNIIAISCVAVRLFQNYCSGKCELMWYETAAIWCQYSLNKMGKAHITWVKLRKEKKGKNKRLRTRNWLNFIIMFMLECLVGCWSMVQARDGLVVLCTQGCLQFVEGLRYGGTDWKVARRTGPQVPDSMADERSYPAQSPK